MKKLFLSAICFSFLCCFLQSCGIPDNKVQAPVSYDAYHLADYQKTLEELQNAGFTNIDTSTSSTLSSEKDGLVNQVSIDGNYCFFKGSVHSKNAPVTISVYKMLESGKAEDDSKIVESVGVQLDDINNTSSLNRESIEEDVSQWYVDDSIDFSYSELQRFFVDLSLEITISELEDSIEQAGFYCRQVTNGSNARDATYVAYQIYDTEPEHTIGSYVGKQSGDVFQDYIVVVFDYADQTLEYFLYLTPTLAKSPSSFFEILYYNSGKCGDISSVLWGEYMTEDVRGFYYRDHWYIGRTPDDRHLVTYFRDDEDVPYYYRGESERTGLVAFPNSESVMNYLLSLMQTNS